MSTHEHPTGCHCATCGANRNPHGFAYFIVEEFSEPPSDEALAWFREHQRPREDARYRNSRGQVVTVSGVGSGVTIWQTWPAGYEPPDPR